MSAAGGGSIVLLDKDGTLVTNVPHNVDPTRVELALGARGGLALLGSAGIDIAIVTNQPGVAYGWFPEQALDLVRLRIEALIAPFGVRLRALYHCPHHPGGTVSRYAVDCECRKPRCGLLLRARDELGLDLSRCWMVGDILDDVEAGRRAGCRTILVDNGGETEWLRGPLRQPDVIVNDLTSAAHAILTWPSATDHAMAPNARHL